MPIFLNDFYDNYNASSSTKPSLKRVQIFSTFLAFSSTLKIFVCSFQPLMKMVGSTDIYLQEAAAGCIGNIRSLALANASRVK